MAQHTRKGASIQAITANRLRDGEVVYQTEKGGWSERFSDSEILKSAEIAESRLEEALRAVDSLLVVEPYLFEVLADDDGAMRPVSVRERIRMRGPTVRADLGKQAER